MNNIYVTGSSYPKTVLRPTRVGFVKEHVQTINTDVSWLNELCPSNIVRFESRMVV